MLLPEGTELDDEAVVLVCRGGIYDLLGVPRDAMLADMAKLKIDRHFWSRKHGKVCQKRARGNNCIAEFEQEANHKEKMGTVQSFSELKGLSGIRLALPEIFGEKAAGLFAETNDYNSSECGIGFHGDAERKMVICAKQGSSMVLCFQAFQNSAPIGNRLNLELHDGDFYVMSEKATGNDWLKKKKVTFRHAAGHEKYRPSNDKILAAKLKRGVKRQRSN